MTLCPASTVSFSASPVRTGARLSLPGSAPAVMTSASSSAAPVVITATGRKDWGRITRYIVGLLMGPGGVARGRIVAGGFHVPPPASDARTVRGCPQAHRILTGLLQLDPPGGGRVRIRVHFPQQLRSRRNGGQGAPANGG